MYLWAVLRKPVKWNMSNDLSEPPFITVRSRKISTLRDHGLRYYAVFSQTYICGSLLWCLVPSFKFMLKFKSITAGNFTRFWKIDMVALFAQTYGCYTIHHMMVPVKVILEYKKIYTQTHSMALMTSRLDKPCGTYERFEDDHMNFGLSSSFTHFSGKVASLAV